jgi:NADH:quinone reductase (non-electrogenic)
MDRLLGKKLSVAVIGGGFGGLEAVRALAKADVEVTLIDKKNHHCFQPLLYQVATAALSPADVAWPIRSLVSDQSNTTVIMSEVTHVDASARVVSTAQGSLIPYDYLVLATGVTTSYFNHPEWAKYAPGLKTIEEARRIRAQILTCFETAERTQDEIIKCKSMTFVIVGADRQASNSRALSRTSHGMSLRAIFSISIRGTLGSGCADRWKNALERSHYGNQTRVRA